MLLGVHKESQCFNCGKKGHLKLQCRNPQQVSKGQVQRKAHYVEVTQQDEDDLERAVFAIAETPPKTQRTPIINVSVVLEDTEMEMELVTGVEVSVVSHTDYCKYFKHLTLTDTKRQLHAYTGISLFKGSG